MNPDSSETEQDHRLGRIRLLDEQRVNLDGFAQARGGTAIDGDE